MAPSRPRSLRSLAFSSRQKPSPEPPSPTFSDSTNVNFGPNGPEKIITRKNLKASLRAYESLMNVTADYRAALMSMSKVTAAFADALESCSSLKGPSYEAGTRLQAASGLHHLIGNHWHVLAETIDKKFEKPLRQHLETYSTIVNDRSASYERTLRDKSQIIRDTEMRSLNRKERNLQSFREALSVLQRQVDDLDDLKASYYREIIEHEEQVWEVVQAKACIVVRSTMDVFDRFTAKASDPVIEVMLQSVPDPFDSYGPPQAEDQIFSILAPLSIMASQSSSTSPMTATSEFESVEAPPSSHRIAPWIPKEHSRNTFPTESPNWGDVNISSPMTSPPRSVSPTVISFEQSSTPSSRLRKSESKLRNVLSSIDEIIPPTDTKDSETPSPPPLSNTQETQLGPEQQQPDWSFTYGESPYINSLEDMTPRHSMLFPELTDIPPDIIREPPNESDERFLTRVAS